jgi:rare lipoprotein A
VGKPYQIDGKWYYPRYDPSYDRVGIASWYGADFHGLSTANGEVFDKDRISAAHPTLPLPSLARVTNLENGRSIVLRVNDRGPFVDDRLIDLSEAAAEELGYRRNGLAKVRVQFVQIADARGGPPRLGPVPPPPRAPVVATPPRAIAAASAPPRPAPTPARPAAPSSTPALEPARRCDGGTWVVQVGAFADSTSARQVVAETAHLEHVRMEPAFTNGIAVARVRLGPVATAVQAQALLDRVHGLGHPQAYITCGAPLPGPVGVS